MRQSFSYDSLYEFISKEVLQYANAKHNQYLRLNFVKGFADYLTTQKNLHTTIALNQSCQLYQLGVANECGSGSASFLAIQLYKATLITTESECFFQPATNLCDEKHENLYILLQSFHKHLGIWIQYKTGHSRATAK